MNNQAMNKLSYGLFILTARENGRDNGCIVNTVMQVTGEPARITVAVNKSNLTHDMILRTGVFNASVLSEKSVFETYKHWGFQSGKTVDKTVGTAFSRSENGLIYIAEQCNSYLSAKVVSSIDLGTHTLFIADVTDAQVLDETNSATYAYYHKNIKPSQKKSAEKKSGYICTVCGYIYEGDPLPDDFVCPVCKHPAKDFKKI